MQSSAVSEPSGSLEKPTWRGRSHLLATFIALPAALWLYSSVPTDAQSAVGLYGITLVLLFGISGSYHVPNHPKRREHIIRAIDHSMIYVFIAGSYTPFIYALPSSDGDWVLPVLWGGALGGALKSALWPTAPRAVNTAVYVALGWVAVPVLPAMYAGFDSLAFGLLLFGGLLFTVGGVIYARRFPDPWPTYFGFHEIFHLGIIAGAACHFIAIWHLLVS